MKSHSIIELGKQGSENLALDVTLGLAADQPLHDMISVIRRFPKLQIDAETEVGVLRPVDTRMMPLANPKVFELCHQLATYEPILYATDGSRTVMGMLSVNYDTTGTHRQPTLKLIPLATAYPLTSKLDPDARMATMLAGAVSAERQGVGNDGGIVAEDFEHKATILGAISVGDSGLAVSHANHAVRASSSVATGLTDGRLGNLYVPDSAVSDFTGYGEPIVIDPAAVGAADMLLIPDRFLDSEAAWGGTYDDAPRIMLGAGLQVLYGRQGSGAIQSQVGALAERVR